MPRQVRTPHADKKRWWRILRSYVSFTCLLTPLSQHLAAPRAMPSQTSEVKAWFSRVFSGKKSKSATTTGAADAPASPTSSTADAAITEMSRRSALVKNSVDSGRARKSTDLMGELADDFHRLKDATPKPAAKAADPVWD